MRAAAGQLGFAAFGVPDKPAPAPAPAPSLAAQRWLAALLVSLPVGTEHTPLEWGFAVRLLDERYLGKASRFEHHGQRLKDFGFARYDSYDRSKVVSDAPKSKQEKAKDAVSWWYGFVIYWAQVEEHGVKADAAIRRAAETTPDEPVRINGIAALEEITFDDERVTVVGIDEEGLLMRSEHDGEDLEASWAEIECVSPGVWRQRLPVRKAAKAPKVKAPKPAKAAKVAKAKPHRLTPEPGADELAQRGMHIYAVLIDGDWTRIERRQGELAHDWTERARTEAAQDARVRLYDGKPRCVWDSLDGGSP